MKRSIITFVLSALVTCCLADPFYDTVESRDPALMPRSEATFRVHNAVIAKIASCPDSDVAFALTGILSSDFGCEDKDLNGLRSCAQRDRYVKRSEVDDCVYAILLVPCDASYNNVEGNQIANGECRHLFGTPPLLYF